MTSSSLATDVYFDLSDGSRIPALGLGTVAAQNPAEVKQQVITAVKAGYRLIDTAWWYGTEKYVGEALKSLFEEGVVERKDLFVVTKYWPCLWHNPGKSLDQSLEALQLDYVDLLLQHYPVAFQTDENGHPSVPRDDQGRLLYADDPVTGTKFIESYHKLEGLLDESPQRVKSVGVSNYSIPKLRQLLAAVKKHPPIVNQMELHPLLPERDLVKFNTDNGVHVSAYSPVGSSGAPIVKLPLVQQLAEKYAVSGNEVANAYNILQGISSLPRSSNLERIRSNVRLPQLSSQELDELYQLGVENPQRYILEDWGHGLGLRWFTGDKWSKEFD